MITKHRLLLALALSATRQRRHSGCRADGFPQQRGGRTEQIGRRQQRRHVALLADRPVERWRQGVELQQHDQCRRYPAVLCENNVLSANGAEGVKDQLLSKLGITSTENAKSGIISRAGRLAADRRRQEPGSEQPGTSQITEKVKQKPAIWC